MNRYSSHKTFDIALIEYVIAGTARPPAGETLGDLLMRPAAAGTVSEAVGNCVDIMSWPGNPKPIVELAYQAALHHARHLPADLAADYGHTIRQRAKLAGVKPADAAVHTLPLAPHRALPTIRALRAANGR